MFAIVTGKTVLLRCSSSLSAAVSLSRASLHSVLPIAGLCLRCLYGSASVLGRRTGSSSPVYQFNLASNLLYGPVISRRKRRTGGQTAASSARGVARADDVESSTFAEEPAQSAVLPRAFPAVNESRTDIASSSDQEHPSDPFLLDYITTSPDPAAVPSSCRHLPSVTRILSETMSEEARAALLRWQSEMEAKLGEEGFQQLKRSMFATGSQLHRMIGEQLSSEDPSEAHASPEPDPNVDATELAGFWRSVQPVLDHVSPGSAQLETRVTHPVLGYSGFLDTVAEYRRYTLLLEWKTVRRPRYTLASMYDAPVQVAAYLGALNYQQFQQGGSQVLEAAVVAIDVRGKPARCMLMDQQQCRHYWKLWLQRLKLYQERNIENPAQ